MTTHVTEGARQERLPPSFLASRDFAAEHSRGRAHPLLNLKKKRLLAVYFIILTIVIFTLYTYIVHIVNACESDQSNIDALQLSRKLFLVRS